MYADKIENRLFFLLLTFDIRKFRVIQQTRLVDCRSVFWRQRFWTMHNTVQQQCLAMSIDILLSTRKLSNHFLDEDPPELFKLTSEPRKH